MRGKSFADRLNWLFATRLTPDGRPYTLREVSDRTRISIGYLGNMRRGAVTMPTADKVQALADFFGVPITFFTREDVPILSPDALDEPLLEALAKPHVREFALRAGELGDVERAVVLQMLKNAQELARQVREGMARQDLDVGPEPSDDTAE